MNGISLSDYIRSRKMTLVGYDLKSTDQRVVDVSCQYGYDSSTSFTKAFQQFHGIAPKDARN
ncbi:MULTISPECIES: helix-turn-helix domain-containing protein [Hungatella]|uniref:helix-turn-helix domain-containing protein n=1 Tax=Hungatella TaxID=1649459 RepID=UPI000B1E4429|nr:MULTISPECIES: helix-turn-helix domain-containing protein [Hungatella]MCQ4828426.1 helix-turn-helix domain-containing protein [Hungatella sp. SL.1.14]